MRDDGGLKQYMEMLKSGQSLEYFEDGANGIC